METIVLITIICLVVGIFGQRRTISIYKEEARYWKLEAARKDKIIEQQSKTLTASIKKVVRLKMSKHTPENRDFSI